MLWLLPPACQFDIKRKRVTYSSSPYDHGSLMEDIRSPLGSIDLWVGMAINSCRWCSFALSFLVIQFDRKSGAVVSSRRVKSPLYAEAKAGNTWICFSSMIATADLDSSFFFICLSFFPISLPLPPPPPHTHTVAYESIHGSFPWTRIPLPQNAIFLRVQPYTVFHLFCEILDSYLMPCFYEFDGVSVESFQFHL